MTITFNKEILEPIAFQECGQDGWSLYFNTDNDIPEVRFYYDRDLAFDGKILQHSDIMKYANDNQLLLLILQNLTDSI